MTFWALVQSTPALYSLRLAPDRIYPHCWEISPNHGGRNPHKSLYASQGLAQSTPALRPHYPMLDKLHPYCWGNSPHQGGVCPHGAPCTTRTFSGNILQISHTASSERYHLLIRIIILVIKTLTERNFLFLPDDKFCSFFIKKSYHTIVPRQGYIVAP